MYCIRNCGIIVRIHYLELSNSSSHFQIGFIIIFLSGPIILHSPMLGYILPLIYIPSLLPVIQWFPVILGALQENIYFTVIKAMHFLVLVSAYLPCILLPGSSKSIFSSFLGSSTINPPWSRSVTVPVPQCPFGILPLMSAYLRVWSFVWMASRLMPGLVGGVFGSTKLLRMPSISSLRP